MTDPREKEILELLNSPDTFNKGFELLVKTYQRGIYFVIRRMILDHEETNDLVQEVFIKVFRSFSRFKNQSTLYTWIYSIAVNTTLNALTSKKNKARLSGEISAQLVAEKLRSDPWFDTDEVIIRFQQAMALLPGKQRIVFQMRYYDETPYEELSKILNTSIGALKASYHHAAKKIGDFITSH